VFLYPILCSDENSEKHPSKSPYFIVDELGGQLWYDFKISKNRN
jgi:hypothetical protein